MPDMASLTLSSLNFVTGASINEPDIILGLINEMDRFGVIPELECFDSGMINMAKYLIKRSIVKPPFYFNVILGNLYNAQCELSTLSDIKSQIPLNSITTIGGIGSQQLKSNVYGLLDFDGIRIGLEDNLYFKDKEKTTNLKLLKRARNIIEELGLEVMTPGELKNLGFKNRIQK
jgi:3-keto-5-aminohexanoate cleavage enzyme